MKETLNKLKVQFGKWLIHGLGIVTMLWLVGITYAAVSSWDTLTATMWNNRNAPDFDSGRIAADSISRHTQTVTHGLWVLPDRFQIYYANSANPTWHVQADSATTWVTYQSPEASFATANDIVIDYYEWDYLIYCDTGANPCPESITTSYDSWFMRVKVRK